MDKNALVLSFILGLVIGVVSTAIILSPTKKNDEDVHDAIMVRTLKIKNLEVSEINGQSIENFIQDCSGSNWINPDAQQEESTLKGIKLEKMDTTKLNVRKITGEDIRKSLQFVPQTPIHQLQ